jgi:hypothetical protein
VRKWALVVLSLMMADATHSEWALPWTTPLQPLQAGVDDTLSALEGLAEVLVVAINRCVCVCVSLCMCTCVRRPTGRQAGRQAGTHTKGFTSAQPPRNCCCCVCVCVCCHLQVVC